jgi:hypothetical protein
VAVQWNDSTYCITAEIAVGIEGGATVVGGDGFVAIVEVVEVVEFVEGRL